MQAIPNPEPRLVAPTLAAPGIPERRTLPSPADLLRDVPATARARQVVAAQRAAAAASLQGADDRLLVVAGPCSIHDPQAALDYGRRLSALSMQHRDTLVVLMRAYFEKPRTRTGWKGFLHDPDLGGRSELGSGLTRARSLLGALADQGLGLATEFLDPLAACYVSDLIAWAAIGARTSESQPHRELASALGCPVGFKNHTGGGLHGALNAIAAAAAPHTRLSIGADGRACMERTQGNRHGHLVLRGGASGPNFGPQAVQEAIDSAQQHGVSARLMIDCSHGNSGKCHHRQAQVLDAVAAQIGAGQTGIAGVMLESHLVAGQQVFVPGAPLVYGQSITDACMDLGQTAHALSSLAAAVQRRRAAGPCPTDPHHRATSR